MTADAPKLGVRAWPVNADLGGDAVAAWNSDHHRDLNSGHEVSQNRLKAARSWSTRALSREGGQLDTEQSGQIAAARIPGQVLPPGGRGTVVGFGEWI